MYMIHTDNRNVLLPVPRVLAWPRLQEAAGSPHLAAGGPGAWPQGDGELISLFILQRHKIGAKLGGKICCDF